MERLHCKRKAEKLKLILKRVQDKGISSKESPVKRQAVGASYKFKVSSYTEDAFEFVLTRGPFLDLKNFIIDHPGLANELIDGQHPIIILIIR